MNGICCLDGNMGVLLEHDLWSVIAYPKSLNNLNYCEWICVYTYILRKIPRVSWTAFPTPEPGHGFKETGLRSLEPGEKAGSQVSPADDPALMAKISLWLEGRELL